MIFIVSNVIPLLLFPEQVYNLDPQRKDMITDLYKDQWKMLNMYHEVQQDIGRSKNSSYPCDILKETTNELANKTRRKLKITSKVIRGQNGFVLTLDGENYIDLPAIIKCSVELEDDELLEFYYIISAYNGTVGRTYLRVFEDENYGNKKAFIILNLWHEKLLKQSYNDDNFEKMTKWYESNKDENDINIALCKLLNRKISRNKILYGKIEISERTLLLSENSWVYIPGFLKCVIKHADGREKINYFISSLQEKPRFSYWYKMYLSDSQTFVMLPRLELENFTPRNENNNSGNVKITDNT